MLECHFINNSNERVPYVREVISYNIDLNNVSNSFIEYNGHFYNANLPITAYMFLLELEAKPYKIEGNISYYNKLIDEKYIVEHPAGSSYDHSRASEELKIIFPANKISKNYILITRLRPNEHLHLIATAVKKTGKLNASFSPVSLSNFYFIEDEKEAEKYDNVLDKHRSFHKNKYGDPSKIQFQIESGSGARFYFAGEMLIDEFNLNAVNYSSRMNYVQPLQKVPFKVQAYEGRDGTNSYLMLKWRLNNQGSYVAIPADYYFLPNLKLF